MKHKSFIVIFMIILTICVALTYIGTNFSSAGTIAEVYSGGALMHEINLSEVSDCYELPIQMEGHKNIILVEKGKISIKEANCPDKLCVRQGAIKNSSYPIVCLPNEVIIKIKGINANTPDAVSR